MDERNYFSVVVAGDKPKKILSRYSSSKKGEKHIVYEFDKAEIYQKRQILYYEEVLKSDKLSDIEIEYLKEEVESWKKMTPKDFYFELTAGYEVDENGNALSDKNIDAKFSSYTLSNPRCTPLILKNGQKVYSAKKKDIDWGKIHLGNTWKYEVTWDTVIENKAPKNDAEKAIRDNMLPWKTYLQANFDSKEDYVKSSDSFFGYAFVSEKLGWNELEDNFAQFKWVAEFYDKFIVPLSDDTLITMCECVRN